MLWGHGVGSLVHFEGRVTANQSKVILTDHLYPVQRFNPDASGLFQKMV